MRLRTLFVVVIHDLQKQLIGNIRMWDQDAFFYRSFFKLRVLEAYGVGFQQLINNLFRYSVNGFQAITPWGRWGDGGNDGWVEATGTYYQVYGINSSSTVSPVTVVNKTIEDFYKLLEKWKDVKNYYFVFNDHFNGAPAQLCSALQVLKKKQKLAECRALVGADLETMFMSLDSDQKQMIVGGIPSSIPSHIDPRSVGEILRHLADTDISPGYLVSDPPDLDEKIKFNGLSDCVGEILKSRWFQVPVVDQFLKMRDPGLSQAIAKDISLLYEQSKEIIPATEIPAADLRYVWMIDQLIPELAHKHPHSLKAYREASQVIISKYFETCDAYEHPKQLTSA